MFFYHQKEETIRPPAYFLSWGEKKGKRPISEGRGEDGAFR